MLSVLCAHVSSDPFNLTSFSVISDPNEFETIEWDDEGEYEGGGPLDRVVVNNWPPVYVRIYIESGAFSTTFVIMTNNDILHTKYIVSLGMGRNFYATHIGDPVHIVINDVAQNMGTKLNDAMMNEGTTIRIYDISYSATQGTWTSTIEPDNVTVELNCKVVKNDGTIVTAKCGSDQWPNSVFNRIPIRMYNGKAEFGHINHVNHALFGKESFSVDGSVPSGWSQYKVDGHESNLTIGEQVTIMGLPESFVSHWVDTIHAKAYMGDDYAMLVPPSS